MVVAQRLAREETAASRIKHTEMVGGVPGSVNDLELDAGPDLELSIRHRDEILTGYRQDLSVDGPDSLEIPVDGLHVPLVFGLGEALGETLDHLGAERLDRVGPLLLALHPIRLVKPVADGLGHGGYVRRDHAETQRREGDSPSPFSLCSRQPTRPR